MGAAARKHSQAPLYKDTRKETACHSRRPSSLVRPRFFKVKNTAALATNQRFTVAKADPAGLAAPAPAPLQRVFEDSGAARAEQSGEDLQTRMARAAARSGSGASGGGGGGNGGRSNQERPAAWDDEQDGVWEPGSGASKGKAKKANKGKKVKKPKKNPSTTGEL